jgi:hypothetical protein
VYFGCIAPELIVSCVDMAKGKEVADWRARLCSARAGRRLPFNTVCSPTLGRLGKTMCPGSPTSVAPLGIRGC